MAAPTPDVVAEWVVEVATNQAYKPLRGIVETALTLRLRENSAEQNADLSEKLGPSVIKHLEELLAEEQSEGISPRFEVSLEGESRVTGQEAYFRVLETPEKPLLTKLRAMNPDAFECFCADILSSLGAKAARVGGSNDGGVDFIALNLQLGERVKFAPRVSQALVVGQAKRYKEGNNITPTMLREFVGGAILKADQMRVSNSFDAGLLTPVVFAYWTTSDFHHDARKYARAMGMWYLNGLGLTQLAVRAGLRIE